MNNVKMTWMMWIWFTWNGYAGKDVDMLGVKWKWHKQCGYDSNDDADMIWMTWTLHEQCGNDINNVDMIWMRWTWYAWVREAWMLMVLNPFFIPNNVNALLCFVEGQFYLFPFFIFWYQAFFPLFMTVILMMAELMMNDDGIYDVWIDDGRIDDGNIDEYRINDWGIWKKLRYCTNLLNASATIVIESMHLLPWHFLVQNGDDVEGLIFHQMTTLLILKDSNGKFMIPSEVSLCSSIEALLTCILHCLVLYKCQLELKHLSCQCSITTIPQWSIWLTMDQCCKHHNTSPFGGSPPQSQKPPHP